MCPVSAAPIQYAVGEESAGSQIPEIAVAPDDRDARPNVDRLHFRLYVTGLAPLSMRAVKAVNELCGHTLQGHCDLRVIDVYRQPALAGHDHVLATPTLIFQRGTEPERRIVGEMSSEDQLVDRLALRPAP